MRAIGIVLISVFFIRVNHPQNPKTRFVRRKTGSHGCLNAKTRTLTPDSRAVTDYHIILEMPFNSLKDLAMYGKNKDYLKVRSLIKNDLAAVPVVYDSFKE